MDNTFLSGKITSVNHEKHYVSIEYLHKDKKRTITCRTDEGAGQKGKKAHQYRIGDVVRFQIKGADRGTRIVAYNLRFLYNTAVEQLVLQAATNNRFTGYLKLVENSLFMKETVSYLFFPLILSPWETPPAKESYNELLAFKLLNLDRPNNLAAELFKHDYIPEYHKAVQHYKEKKAIEATVTKVTAYGVQVSLFQNKIQAKLQFRNDAPAALKAGDLITVKIVHLTHTRVVVEPF